MSKRAPAFQFYPDRWVAMTLHLSPVTYWVLHRIWCLAWNRGAEQHRVPADVEWLAKRLSIDANEVRSALTEIQDPHSPLLDVDEDCFVVPQLLDAVEAQRRQRSKTAAATEAASRKRRATCTNPAVDQEGRAPGGLEVVRLGDDHKPRERTKAAEYSQEFERWWAVYPKKAGKMAAWKAWQKAKRAGMTVEQAMAAAERYVAWVSEEGRMKADKKPRPYRDPATWLNQGGWGADEWRIEDLRQPKPVMRNHI